MLVYQRVVAVVFLLCYTYSRCLRGPTNRVGPQGQWESAAAQRRLPHRAL